MLRTIPDVKTAHEGTAWQQFQDEARPSLDQFGHPILDAPFADKLVALGISRGSFLGGEQPRELRRELLVTRLRAKLAAGRTPRTSDTMLRDDWQLLQGVISAEPEGITARADVENQ